MWLPKVRPAETGRGRVGWPAPGMSLRRWRGSREAGPRATLALLGLLLAGCNLGPDYQGPAVELPPGWRATQATAEADWPSSVWWRGFRSPTLDRLIEQARGQNFDIAAAIARVRQADAQARIAGAALLPTLDLGGTASWQQVSLSRRGFTTGIGGSGAVVSSGGGERYADVRQYGLQANASYQLDFWGRNRAVLGSAQASAVFSRFDQQVVSLTVVTDIANTWFTALALQDRLHAAERNL
jgi:multidrug efflux system outer membrane protein